MSTNAQPSGSVIWIINQYTGSPRHGMEYRHYYLARQMAERGHRVVIISGSHSHLFTRPPQVSRRFTLELIDGVTYCWVAVPRYQRAISLARVLNMAAFALRLERLPTDRLPRPRRDPGVVSFAVSHRGRRTLGTSMGRAAGKGLQGRSEVRRPRTTLLRDCGPSAASWAAGATGGERTRWAGRVTAEIVNLPTDVTPDGRQLRAMEDLLEAWVDRIV